MFPDAKPVLLPSKRASLPPVFNINIPSTYDLPSSLVVIPSLNEGIIIEKFQEVAQTFFENKKSGEEHKFYFYGQTDRVRVCVGILRDLLEHIYAKSSGKEIGAMLKIINIALKIYKDKINSYSSMDVFYVLLFIFISVIIYVKEIVCNSSQGIQSLGETVNYISMRCNLNEFKVVFDVGQEDAVIVILDYCMNFKELNLSLNL
jgi:hypothetical protein